MHIHNVLLISKIQNRVGDGNCHDYAFTTPDDLIKQVDGYKECFVHTFLHHDLFVTTCIERIDFAVFVVTEFSIFTGLTHSN